IQRERIDMMPRGNFHAPHHVANLRTIAVRHHQLMTGRDQIRQRPDGLARRFILLRNISFLSWRTNRVSAQCSNDKHTDKSLVPDRLKPYAFSRPSFPLPGVKIALAAGESFIGSTVRSTPSNARSAPATAGAVGTKPSSPTPRAPYGHSGSGVSTKMTSISGIWCARNTRIDLIVSVTMWPPSTTKSSDRA